MRPTRNQTLMNHARVAAARATCSRQSVGVVIAREGRVLVTGYNGAPAGMDHCVHECDCASWDSAGYISGPNPPINRVEVHLGRCALHNACTISVHAEANAIAYAARWGIQIEGAELFTTFSPCLPCGQLIINSGITRVVYGGVHRDQRGLTLCELAGIKIVALGEWDLIK
jgi:dCMP deaminase